MKKVISRISLILLTVFAPMSVFAQEAAGADSYKALGLALGAGFAIGIAALGGALGQSRAAAAALEGIGRNPG